MKRTILSALLISAFASVATVANAGVIQASFKNYAAEVFGDNTVVLTAPTINYALALPLSGTDTNPNSFTISWTLGSGEWVVAPLLSAIQLNTPDNNPVNRKNPASITLSTDKKTITANFVLNEGVNYTTGSQIVLGTTGPLNIAQITQVGTTLGAPAVNGCANEVASIPVTVRLANAAGIEFESNFSQAPLLNTISIVQSSVALRMVTTSSSAYTPATARELGRVNVLIPSLGRAFTSGSGAVIPVADATVLATDRINIGRVAVTDRAALFDLDGTAVYSSRGPLFATNPATEVGVVEASNLVVNLSGQFLVDPGTRFYGTVANDCTGTEIGTGVISANGQTATLTVSNAELQSLAGALATDVVRPLNMCYRLPVGNTRSVPLSQFQVTGGSLNKAATSLEAANPVCPTPVYNLVANGVQVDVRNYLPQVVRAASGWYSVIRIINTDDAQTVSPVARALLADGTLGAFVVLDGVQSVDNKSGPFRPREVRYYTSTVIDAALTAAANGALFGANDVGGNARLRITAPSSSMRIQNYNFNPATGNFFEASAAQGDDGPDYNRAADANNK